MRRGGTAHDPCGRLRPSHGFRSGQAAGGIAGTLPAARFLGLGRSVHLRDGWVSTRRSCRDRWLALDRRMGLRVAGASSAQSLGECAGELAATWHRREPPHVGSRVLTGRIRLRRFTAGRLPGSLPCRARVRGASVRARIHPRDTRVQGSSTLVGTHPRPAWAHDSRVLAGTHPRLARAQGSSVLAGVPLRPARAEIGSASVRTHVRPARPRNFSTLPGIPLSAAGAQGSNGLDGTPFCPVRVGNCGDLRVALLSRRCHGPVLTGSMECLGFRPVIGRGRFSGCWRCAGVAVGRGRCSGWAIATPFLAGELLGVWCCV
jgi:hypothetical protein